MIAEIGVGSILVLVVLKWGPGLFWVAKQWVNEYTKTPKNGN